jgi:uncharacterized protein (DUF58 family)
VTAGLLVPARIEAPGAPWGRPPWTFGPATLWLLVLGVPLLAAVWADRRAAVVVAAWDAIVLAAWAIDLRRMPGPSALTVSRTWSAAAALGVRQTVRLGISNRGAVPIQARLTDFASPALRPAPAELSATVPPGGEAWVEYDIVPTSRGDAPMDFVAIRYRSAAGLAERWAGVSLAQGVRVYPDIGEAQRQALALIRARQIVMEKRRARVHGLGRDFESLREFQQGDELRDVCWTAAARRGRLVTRTYQPERSQTVWIVVDAGRLMRAKDGLHTGLDRAVNAAFALAQVASAAGDRVGLLAYGRAAQQRLLPGRGGPHLRVFLDALAVTRAEPSEADHARAAAAVMSTQKRRALIVWLTDVAETAGVPEVIESAARMVPQHVLLFAITRPANLAALAAQVPTSGRDLYRVMAAQEMVERRAVLLAGLRERGAMALEVPSADLTGTLVDRYLGVKQRNLL